MKKMLFLLLAAILPVMASAYDAYIDGIYYILNKDAKTATVTSDNKNAYAGSVTIPATVDYSGETYNVTTIGVAAFYNCSGLTSVSIPTSVTSIGYEAFRYCNCLASIIIPNSVKSIGNRAFSFCRSLSSITIPPSVTIIGDWAFSYCSSLASAIIPNTITSIGDQTFCGCSSLSSVTIPNSVTTIGDLSFSGCSGLKSVTIPSSVTTIKRYAFEKCSSLTSIIIPNSVTSIGDYAFSGCSSLITVTIPNSVISIGEGIFSYCNSLTSISISKNVTSIVYGAFYGCSSLKDIVIPISVTKIEELAFSECTALESVKALPETPPFLYDNSFSNYNIPLYASATAIAAYQAKEPWSKFSQFLTLDGQEVEMPQCATPTIDYANWKLTFSCETEGAEIVSKAVCSDSQEGSCGTISLMPTYTITAFAKAEGCRDSEVVTATISWKDGRPVIIRGFNNVSLEEGEPVCDVNQDGTVDVADIATIISAMASKSRDKKE